MPEGCVVQLTLFTEAVVNEMDVFNETDKENQSLFNGQLLPQNIVNEKKFVFKKELGKFTEEWFKKDYYLHRNPIKNSLGQNMFDFGEHFRALSPHICPVLTYVWIWHFRTWLSGGLGSVSFMVGFNDLKGLFQHTQMILILPQTSIFGHCKKKDINHEVELLFYVI